MTLNSIFSKLKKQNKGQYLILGFCISLSVLLITAFALMYMGPTVQDFLPEGGDTRKMANLLLAVSIVGCTIFTLYASGLFFRFKSREYGIFLALGTPKKALKPLLFHELAYLTIVSALIGLVLAVPVSFGIWKLFENFLLSSKDTIYRFGWNGFVVGIGFCMVLALLLFLRGTRFIRRTNIMDVLREGQKTEMVKEIPAWFGTLGIILTIVGIIISLGLPSIMANLFYINLSSFFNFTYLIALVGIYLILLSCVAQTSAGKNKEKYYKNLVSISLMRFSAKSATKNMCVMALMMFCCLFAAFYAMLYATTAGLIEENASAFAFHFPLEEKQITKEDIESLADDYDMSLASYGENEAANLVISYRNRDLIDSRYVTLDQKQAKHGLFFSESAYENLTGQDISVEPSTYKTITPVDYNENLWNFMDGLYAAYNPDTREDFPLTYSGSVEYNALSDMSNPYTYIVNDMDYQTMTASLGSQYLEKIICFDVKDTLESYVFAKALEAKYVNNASSLSDFMGYYDAWEHMLAKEKGESYGYAGSIGLSSPESADLYDWKYEPRITPVIQQDFMQQISIYVMLCLYIFVIMIASIGIMAYVRSITVATENKFLFGSLKKLGAGSAYAQSILKMQLRKIFQYPTLIGCSISWIFSLAMSFFNDSRLTANEILNLGKLLGLIAFICIFLYMLYRKASKKALEIVGIV